MIFASYVKKTFETVNGLVQLARQSSPLFGALDMNGLYITHVGHYKDSTKLAAIRNGHLQRCSVQRQPLIILTVFERLSAKFN